MPIPEGYLNIEDATAKYGRNRNWWYTQVREGNLTGYEIPGFRGTYVRTEEIEKLIMPRPKMGNANEQVG